MHVVAKFLTPSNLFLRYKKACFKLYDFIFINKQINKQTFLFTHHSFHESFLAILGIFTYLLAVIKINKNYYNNNIIKCQVLRYTDYYYYY
jgi:hypothetical protein